MESRRYLSFLLVLLMCFLGSSQAYNFYVGGKHGWVLKPSENYIHWAERNRFQVNDSLTFKYKKGSDSVLIVDEDDYNKCNKAKPIKALEDGDSVFKLDRSGPFFFISGHSDNCKKGQKLIVVVLAVRDGASSPNPPPSPSPAVKPPASPSPKAESPKADSPKSTTPAHSPDFHAPAPAPSAAPALMGGSVGFVVGLGFFFGMV